MKRGCQTGVETVNLTTVMKHYKIINTEPCELIKLGIDDHATELIINPSQTAACLLQMQSCIMPQSMPSGSSMR